MKAIITYTDKKHVAEQIAEKVVDKRLSVTVHISPVESLYVWNERIVNDREWKIDVVCTDECEDGVIKTIKRIHNYEQSAIFIVDIDSDAETRRWIEGR